MTTVLTICLVVAALAALLFLVLLVRESRMRNSEKIGFRESLAQVNGNLDKAKAEAERERGLRRDAERGLSSLQQTVGLIRQQFEEIAANNGDLRAAVTASDIALEVKAAALVEAERKLKEATRWIERLRSQIRESAAAIDGEENRHDSLMKAVSLIIARLRSIANVDDESPKAALTIILGQIEAICESTREILDDYEELAEFLPEISSTDSKPEIIARILSRELCLPTDREDLKQGVWKVALTMIGVVQRLQSADSVHDVGESIEQGRQELLAIKENAAIQESNPLKNRMDEFIATVTTAGAWCLGEDAEDRRGRILEALDEVAGNLGIFAGFYKNVNEQAVA